MSKADDDEVADQHAVKAVVEVVWGGVGVGGGWGGGHGQQGAHEVQPKETPLM